MDSLPVVTVILRRGKKIRATIIDGLTCLWDSRATAIIINRKHAGPSKRRICSNKVDYSTATGPYYTTHNVKVIFCMTDFLEET